MHPWGFAYGAIHSSTRGTLFMGIALAGTIVLRLVLVAALFVGAMWGVLRLSS